MKRCGYTNEPKNIDDLMVRLSQAGLADVAVESDNDGQLIIYTGLKIKDRKGTLVLFDPED